MYSSPMTRPSEDSIVPAPVELAWARLIRAHRVALSGVERALKENGLPPLSWYDALLELKRETDGLRASELEARMLLPQYNVSRLVDRLEKAGYIARRIDPEDGRGRILTLTAEGRTILKRMWPVYADAITRFMGDPLDEEEAETLARLLGRIVNRDQEGSNRRRSIAKRCGRG